MVDYIQEAFIFKIQGSAQYHSFIACLDILLFVSIQRCNSPVTIYALVKFSKTHLYEMKHTRTRISRTLLDVFS